MYSDSRKAQRNSFAHHRAQLLFSMPPVPSAKVIHLAPEDPGDATDHAAWRRERVRAGVLGFAPASASPAA